VARVAQQVTRPRDQLRERRPSNSAQMNVSSTARRISWSCGVPALERGDRVGRVAGSVQDSRVQLSCSMIATKFTSRWRAT
jgi:hypothetical protein